MTSAERKAHNEGAFREANEKLEQSAKNLLTAEDHSVAPFLCECPRPDCTKVVLLTLEEYDHVRALSVRGLAAPGHEDLSIERLVAENERFVLTEKFGEAGDVHSEGDPRP